MASTKHLRGMTLLELMVVVGIVATLATVALPTYREYLKRANRGDARAALLKVAQFMERAATANGMYPLEGQVPQSVKTAEGGRYDITLWSTDGATFTVTATRKPSSQQADDRCGDFRIDHTGNRTVLNAAGGMTADDCWRR